MPHRDEDQCFEGEADGVRVVVVTCGAFYTVVCHSARAILGARPAAARRVSRMSGAAMVLVGLLLLVERALANR
ncbi:MAG TPA: hypothetical protein VFR74_07025 [Jiangellales bacterium]|nr:hypothetical protein [Jiangellales bacterium]